MLKPNLQNYKKELKHLYSLQIKYGQDLNFNNWLNKEIFRVKEELKYLESKK